MSRHAGAFEIGTVLRWIGDDIQDVLVVRHARGWIYLRATTRTSIGTLYEDFMPFEPADTTDACYRTELSEGLWTYV